jgi:prepilin-type N-terminal cleavage/methylation domain-containing protein
MSLLFRRDRDGDGGFTLIEMLVSMIVLSALGTVFMTTVLGAQSSAKNTSSEQDLNEEARLALNRMARELRQADALSSVLNPDGASYSSSAITAVTFTADFNGDGCIDGVVPSPAPSPLPTCQAYTAANPETLTYCWDPRASVRQLYLIPGTLSGPSCQVSGALPILAGQVTSFKLSYRSNQYLYDTTGGDSGGDGITTWTELDDAGPPVGNNDGQLDQPELANVDSVVIDLTVSASGQHQQSYTTQVDLRNMS